MIAIPGSLALSMASPRTPRRRPLRGAGSGVALFCVAVLAAPLGLWVGPALALFAAWLRVPGWWLALIVVAPGARWAVESLQAAPEVHLGILGVLLAVFGLHFLSRVPLYPSSARSVDLAASLLPRDRPCEIMDIGSGTAGAMLRFTQHSDQWHVHGCEQALIPWTIGWLRFAIRGKAYGARLGRYEAQSWRSADMVYAYLSTTAMVPVFERARRELKEGALLVSNEFVPAGVRALAIRNRDDGNDAVVYAWQMIGQELVPLVQVPRRGGSNSSSQELREIYP